MHLLTVLRCDGLMIIGTSILNGLNGLRWCSLAKGWSIFVSKSV